MKLKIVLVLVIASMLSVRASVPEFLDPKGGYTKEEYKRNILKVIGFHLEQRSSSDTISDSLKNLLDHCSALNGEPLYHIESSHRPTRYMWGSLEIEQALHKILKNPSLLASKKASVAATHSSNLPAVSPIQPSKSSASAGGGSSFGIGSYFTLDPRKSKFSEAEIVTSLNKYLKDETGEFEGFCKAVEEVSSQILLDPKKEIVPGMKYTLESALGVSKESDSKARRLKRAIGAAQIRLRNIHVSAATHTEAEKLYITWSQDVASSDSVVVASDSSSASSKKISAKRDVHVSFLTVPLMGKLFATLAAIAGAIAIAVLAERHLRNRDKRKEDVRR